MCASPVPDPSLTHTAAFDLVDAKGLGFGQLSMDECVLLMQVCMAPACRLKGLPQLPVELFEHYVREAGDACTLDPRPTSHYQPPPSLRTSCS